MAQSKMIKGPKYPNQQLRSVALEAYFAGDLSVFHAMGKIQRREKAKFPNLFVPNLRDGEPGALKPFVLKSADSAKTLSLSVNQVAYGCLEYPGYERFKQHGIPLIENALADIGVGSLTRVIYRYENEISVDKDERGGLRVFDFFPNLLPRAVDAHSASIAIESLHDNVWQQGYDSGTKGFHLRIEAGPAGTSLLKATIWASMVGTRDVSKLENAADTVHEKAVAFFESGISDEFRAFIAGSEKDE